MVDRPATVIPNPDPSAITTEAIDRRVDNVMSIIAARLDGMDKAIIVFQDNLTRVPTELDRRVDSLKELIETRINAIENNANRIEDRSLGNVVIVQNALINLRELAATTEQKFKSIAEQFSERDTRTEHDANSITVAMETAFAAAKENTSKIETSFTKNIDGQSELIKANIKSTDDKIADLKDRLTAIENRADGMTQASRESQSRSQDSAARLMGIIAIAVALAIGIVEVLIRGH